MEGQLTTTTARSQAPVDVEKHCAVEMVEGARCRCALTCGRHGMVKKRAVARRSAPFDQLLKELIARKEHDQQHLE